MKFEGLDKGLKSKTDLWISEINEKIEVISSQKHINSEHKKYHSECITFIKNHITPIRIKYAKVSNE